MRERARKRERVSEREVLRQLGIMSSGIMSTRTRKGNTERETYKINILNKLRNTLNKSDEPYGLPGTLYLKRTHS